MSSKSCLAEIDSRSGPSAAIKFSQLPKDERERRLSLLSEDELASLKYNWSFWGRPNQLLPEGQWQTWLIKAGRGFGKTRAGAETTREWVKHNRLVNIIAPTADDARDICIEGESGILAICPQDEKPVYHSSKRQLAWPNGAVSLIFTADEPERLRGKQHMKLWCDEFASWRYVKEAWDQASLGLRLGKFPQAIITTTPKPLPQVKELLTSKNTFLTNGTTYDNRANLAPTFFSKIITKYEGTRLGRQELNAELLEDNPGALWRLSDIDETRVNNDKFWKEIFPNLLRVVGAIDPAVTSGAESDETGIIFCGQDSQPVPHYYVFDDRSDKYTPDGWAKVAVAGYHQYKADRIIGEANNGGDMIESTLRHADPNVSYKKVHASRGKQTRAEPISALYEQKRVHHVGTFGVLEDQMCDYDPLTSTESPDRMDAMVWAMTELSESSTELGMVNYIKDGKASRDMDTMSKMNTAAAMVDKLLNAPTCPSCSAESISDVPGGQKRCQSCGLQWWVKGDPRGLPKNGSRGELFGMGL